jgi:hypothetical protein
VKADPGHIATNWAAANAALCASLEINWNGSWVDESGYLDVSQPGAASGSHYLFRPEQGILSLGWAADAVMSLRLDNEGGRFSRGKAGSPANLYGIHNKPIRLSIGYRHAGGAELADQFTGYVVDVPAESEAQSTVQLTARGMASQYADRKVSTLVYEGLSTDAWIAQLCTEAGIVSTALDHGYCVIPFAYASEQPVLDAVTHAAAAEGGFVHFAASGALTFWNATHWYGAAAVGTLTLDDYGDVSPRSRYTDIYKRVTVEVQPRQRGRLQRVYELKAPIWLPAGAAVLHKARLSLPFIEWHSYELAAGTGGGNAAAEGDVNVSPSSPQSAQRWDVILTNTTTHGLWVSKLDGFAYALEGRDSQSYEYASAAEGQVDRNLDAPQLWEIQTEEQAAHIAETLIAWLRDGSTGVASLQPRRVITASNVSGNPLWEPGDVMHLHSTETGLDGDAIIGGLDWELGSNDYTCTLALINAAGLYPATFHKIGTTVLGAGAYWR